MANYSFTFCVLEMNEENKTIASSYNTERTWTHMMRFLSRTNYSSSVSELPWIDRRIYATPDCRRITQTLSPSEEAKETGEAEENSISQIKFSSTRAIYRWFWMNACPIVPVHYSASRRKVYTRRRMTRMKMTANDVDCRRMWQKSKEKRKTLTDRDSG